MPPYWVLVIITFFACNAQTFMETGAMVTSIRNFDTERYRFQAPALNPNHQCPKRIADRFLLLQLARLELHAVCLLIA